MSITKRHQVYFLLNFIKFLIFMILFYLYQFPHYIYKVFNIKHGLELSKIWSIINYGMVIFVKEYIFMHLLSFFF